MANYSTSLLDPTDYGTDMTGAPSVSWDDIKAAPGLMWDNMNALDKISLTTGAAAVPAGVVFPPAGAALGLISAGTGLASDANNIAENPTDPWAWGGAIIGNTPFGKVGEKLGIYTRADKAVADRVSEMESGFKNRDQIWEATGQEFGTPAYRDKAGNILQAIPDANAKFKSEPLSEWAKRAFTEQNVRMDRTPNGGYRVAYDAGGNNWVYGVGSSQQEAYANMAADAYKQFGPFDFAQRQVNISYPLKDVLDHPELAQHSPQIFRNVRVAFTDQLPKGVMGGYSRQQRTIFIDYETSPEDAFKTLMHELQHNVQEDLALPGGAGTAKGNEILKAAREGVIDAKTKISAADARLAELKTRGNVEQTSALLKTANKLKEIDRLKGYLRDNVTNNSPLTNKRRHILASGAAIMDVNAESRMRYGINWPKKHRPQAERDEALRQYITNAIEAAQKDLDPELVSQVQAAGVKNPSAKYNREIDKVYDQWDREVGRENYGKLIDRRNELQGLLSPYQDDWNPAQKVYKNLAGEAQARLTEEQLAMNAQKLTADGMPWRSKTWEGSPEHQQLILSPDAGEVQGLVGGPLKLPTTYPSVQQSLLDTSYRGVHTAPVRDGANSLDDLSDIYPEDVYDPRKSAAYYGHTGAGDPLDQRTADLVAAFQGKPDADVTIYRAVPKGTTDINPGDWVTINKNYAKSHGDRWVENGQYEIIEMKVKAKDLVTDGNSIHEWGYDPVR